MAKRKSISRRAADCVADIRKLHAFGAEEWQKRGTPYTEEMRDVDVQLIVDLAMKRLVEADRRARKGGAMMRELPILFSAPLVRAILAGTKTVTRRPVKPSVMDTPIDPSAMVSTREEYMRDLLSHCPFGAPGDRLWGRETWSPDCRTVYPCPAAWYRADFGEYDDPAHESQEHATFCGLRTNPRAIGNGNCWACAAEPGGFKWRPSIHMPRWASRILLEVTDVRVERLQDVTEEDAKAEGIPADDISRVGVPCFSARQNFAATWSAIYGAASWESNAWVWRVAFKRIEVR